MLDSVPTKGTESRNRGSKRQNRGGNAPVTQTFYDMPASNDGLEMAEGEIGEKLNDINMMDMRDSIRGIENEDFIKDGGKGGLSITDVDLVNGNEHESDK